MAGRVADIHHLLPAGGLKIVGEHFQRVRHQLLVLPEAEIGDIAHVHSHIHALDQCRKLRRELGLKAVVHADTAGAAAMVLDMGDKTRAAIGSELAAEIHGLKILRSDIEDAEHNTTRFLIMAREAEIPAVDENDCVTSFVFRVRNVPAALFKCLGGFATNGVNMSKLESYMADGKFVAARFYAEVDGHPDRRDTRLALEELISIPNGCRSWAYTRPTPSENPNNAFRVSTTVCRSRLCPKRFDARRREINFRRPPLRL